MRRYGRKIKRHSALVPLSHDHHHALVAARRLRRAADGEETAAEAAGFARFYTDVTVPHFREEEERLFPLVADREDLRPLLVQVLLDHQRLHALAARLDDTGDVRPVMRELGRLLEEHVRREERELFPAIERVAEAELVRSVSPRTQGGGGPVWGQESEELNATLLVWGAGGGPPEHVNDICDVVLFVADGSALLGVDGEEHELTAGDAFIVGKGQRRRIVAGRTGVRYLAVHRRRPPLRIASRSAGEAGSSARA